jgi:pyruvate,water dikinase
MADLVRPHPPLARALRLGNRQEIEAALTPSVSQAFQAYLQRFADRCLEELKLESTTLSDDPMPLYRAVGHMAARPADLADSGAGLVRRQRVKAERRAFRALAWSPVRQLLFRYVLRHARSCVANRENLRFERTQVFGRVRRIMLELGRRFTAAGVLDRPEHVFWLEQHEVFGFVDGSLSCPNLRALAAARRETFAGFAEQAVPADRFRTTGWPFCGNDPTDPATQHDAPADERTGSSDDDACRQGKGACPGQVEGTVRVVRDPRGVELPADTILVAERTDPGWIMLFPAAKALVVERGSLLSHSAIVARELGLPCVVGVQGATSWLADGDRVVIDGSTGQVRRCTPAEVRQ